MMAGGGGAEEVVALVYMYMKKNMHCPSTKGFAFNNRLKSQEWKF